MAFGSCDPSGRWDEVLVHESEEVVTHLLEFSFRFRDVFLRVRRLLLVVLLSLLCLDFNLYLMFFVLWNSSLQSTWILQRSVTVCCPSVVSVSHPFSMRHLSIPELQFPLQSRLGVLLLSRQHSILVLLPCVDDFQYPRPSSSVHLLSSRHCSPRTSRPAVGTALSVLLILACCWVRSSRLLLAMLFCHFGPLSEILVDLLLVVVQVLRPLCSFSTIWLCLFR